MGDTDAITETGLFLLSVPGERLAFQDLDYKRGRRTAWPEIARQCAALLDQLTPTPTIDEMRTSPSLGAIRAMSDDVGILQHGIGLVPDRAHRFCIADNAHALSRRHTRQPRSSADNDPVDTRSALLS